MNEKKIYKISKNLKRIRTKTQIAVANRQYINRDTGEVEEFTVVQKNISADFNFHKIWLQDLLNILDSFGSKKIKVITYLLSKMRNEDNSISCTYRSIEKDTGISYQTIATTMKEMIESNVIKKIATGTYQFNPDIIIKGSSNKRQRLLVEYNIIENEKIKNIDDYYNEIAKEEKIQAIETEILEK